MRSIIMNLIGGWRLPALLVGILLLELGFAAAGHRSREELEETLVRGSAREQVEAFFVLTNRGEPPRPTDEEITEILEGENRLLGEWVMTPNYIRLTTPRVQQHHLDTSDPDEEQFRARFLLEHRMGTYRWLSLEKIRRFRAGGQGR